MDTPSSEEELITYDQFVKFLETFKKEVFNWEDPSGRGEEIWTPDSTNTYSSKDKTGVGPSGSTYYGIVPASYNEVKKLFFSSKLSFNFDI